MPQEPEYDRGYAAGSAEGARTVINLDIDRLSASAARLSASQPHAVAAYNEAIAILTDAASAVVVLPTGEGDPSGA